MTRREVVTHSEVLTLPEAVTPPEVILFIKVAMLKSHHYKVVLLSQLVESRAMKGQYTGSYPAVMNLNTSAGMGTMIAEKAE